MLRSLFGGDGVRGWVCQAGETLCQGLALRIEQCRGARAGNAIDRLPQRHGVREGRHHHVLDDLIVIAAAAPMGIAITFNQPGAFGDFDREFGGARGRLRDQPQPRLGSPPAPFGSGMSCAGMHGAWRAWQSASNRKSSGY